MIDMKKNTNKIIGNKYIYIVLAVSILLVSCQANYDPSYEEVVASNDELTLKVSELEQTISEAESEINDLESRLSEAGTNGEGTEYIPEEMIYGNFEGEFTATVNEVIESYVEVAGYLPVSVMPFQDMPYIIYLSTDIIDELEDGETYRFVIDNARGGVPKVAYELNDEEAIISSYYSNVRMIMVSSFREPTEDELGVSQAKLQFVADE